MKKLAILVICGGCAFGLDTTTETVDQGGIRVTPIRVDLDDGSESVGIDDVQFRNTADVFAGETPRMVITFNYEEHAIEIEAAQVERLAISGGRTRVRVDGAPQIVDVTSSIRVADVLDYGPYSRLRSVELSFEFRPGVNAQPVLAVVSMDANFHCPPFDRRPAEVEEASSPLL